MSAALAQLEVPKFPTSLRRKVSYVRYSHSYYSYFFLETCSKRAWSHQYVYTTHYTTSGQYCSHKYWNMGQPEHCRPTQITASHCRPTHITTK